MAINPMQLFALKGDFDKFKKNHPRFIQFIQAISQDGIKEGTVLECKVIGTDGREMQTNIKVTQDDLELFAKLKNLA